LLYRWSLLCIITVLHIDLCSAVNILLERNPAWCTVSTGAVYLPVVALTLATAQTYCSSACGVALRFCKGHTRAGAHSGHLALTMTPKRIANLSALGVCRYLIKQHAGSAILLPATCWHQVQNLVSSLKASADIVNLPSIQDVLAINTAQSIHYRTVAARPCSGLLRLLRSLR